MININLLYLKIIIISLNFTVILAYELNIIFFSKDLDVIFSNILEIYDFSVTLLGTFEDALEMAEENRNPSIGACYEELAEV